MALPTAEQFGAYEQAFGYFNEALFNSSLPPCILNFSRKNKKGGFFAAERWKKEDLNTHEISLNPDYLNREPILVMAMLVHEMTHLWQYVYGHCSPNNYHNKEWGDKMEELGLMPSDTSAPGGKRTGSSMGHYVLEDGLFEKVFEVMPPEFLMPWVSSGRTGKDKLKGLSKSKDKIKYTCPSCSSNVWGKWSLAIICGNCQADFVKADAG